VRNCVSLTRIEYAVRKHERVTQQRWSRQERHVVIPHAFVFAEVAQDVALVSLASGGEVGEEVVFYLKVRAA